VRAIVPAWRLRARFAVALADMYGDEVPAYHTLVEVTREVNEKYAATYGRESARLGSLDRVTAERHGAIRVGSPRELAQAARVFAAFGMRPVGFYDLRGASKSSVPVVSTAFRPVDTEELGRNPFRVFTSMLTVDDPRFFDTDTRTRLDAFIEARTLFTGELLALADRAAAEGGLPEPEATALLRLATEAFELSDVPVDKAWYDHLEAISSVAADIGGVPSTHINHLTPRVLDIDELYAQMRARGIAMIDEIQGPPSWAGPDVLLRQTSFRALAEKRHFLLPDGTAHRGTLRVRFGEVEQRGVALTRRGRALYDRLVAEIDRRLHEAPGTPSRAEVARDVWRESLPPTEQELALRGLSFSTYRVTTTTEPRPGGTATLKSLVHAGVLTPEPIVYEDFLPLSAAGIFQSNLTGEGARNDDHRGTDWTMAKLSEAIGAPIHDPFDLYETQQEASLRAAESALGLRIDPTHTAAHAGS
jgi:uncharacterized glyoxalase superfamily metalloenzyme YdcJ